MNKKPASQSAFFNPRVLTSFVLCSLGVLVAVFGLGAFPGASTSAQEPNQNQNPGNRHKVSVTDRQLVATLTSQGGRVIADYGSFVLLAVNDGVANSRKA